MSYTDLDFETYKAQFSDNPNSDYVLVDVRETDEYAEGHLPNAINIPLSTFQMRFGEITHDKPIVLVCARGGRSAMAADFMVSQGYENLYNLEGGTMGWVLEGNPLAF